MGTPSGRQLVGQAEQQLLAVAQMGLLDVDAAVGHDAVDDLDRPGALGSAGEELAADGVAHVVREQIEAVDAERGDEGRGDVGLQRHGVVAVGLGREPVAEHVEQQDPTAGAQAVEDGGVVEGRRREAVEDEERGVLLGAERRRRRR